MIRSERSAPSASCPSTEKSALARISEAGKAGVGLVTHPRDFQRTSWSVNPNVAPSARSIRQHHASVVVPSSRWACRPAGSMFHRRTSIRGMDVIEPSRSTSRVTSSVSVSKRTGTSNSKPVVIAMPGAGAAAKVTTPVMVFTVQPVI